MDIEEVARHGDLFPERIPTNSGWSGLFAVPYSVFCELHGLAHQGLFNPGSGLFRRFEQPWCGRGRTFAEAGFQVPPPLVLRVMVRPVEADEHGGKLVVCEDKPAVSVMAVDEHAHGDRA